MRPKSFFSALPSAIVSTALAAGAMLAAGAALAQLRAIPDDAKRAHMRYVREMIIELDGMQARLSPGSQIRSVENRIVLPSALPQGSLLVKFLPDAAGQVHRVWILSPEEAARPDKQR